MLKQLSSSAPATSPQAEKPRKRAWLPLAAVILLFLGSHWWLNEVDGSAFGSVHGKLYEFVQNLLYQHVTPQSAFFCGFALFSFGLFGVLWYKSAGRKRRIYYALFAFFAFQYGAGLLFYILTFYLINSGKTPTEQLVIFYTLWGASLLGVILYELFSRFRR